MFQTDWTHHNLFWNFNSRNVCPGVRLVDERFMLEYKFGKKLFISIVGSTEQKYGDVMISFSIRMEKQRLDLLFCKTRNQIAVFFFKKKQNW